VGVPPETLREDAGGLDRRSVVEISHDDKRSDREPPRPSIALWVVLGPARDLDYREDRLPDRGVQNPEFAWFDRRALRRGVSLDRLGVDRGTEWAVASTADEEPVRQMRSTTPAIAWPKPMHMQATP
jgi:hypothetical protein